MPYARGTRVQHATGPGTVTGAAVKPNGDLIYTVLLDGVGTAVRGVPETSLTILGAPAGTPPNPGVGAPRPLPAGQQDISVLGRPLLRGLLLVGYLFAALGIFGGLVNASIPALIIWGAVGYASYRGVSISPPPLPLRLRCCHEPPVR